MPSSPSQSAPSSMAAPRARPLRAWRYFHPWTLLVGLLLQLHLASLLVFDHMNPAPAPEALVQLPVEVLEVQGPQLRVRLVDDAQRTLEFPASAALLASPHTPLAADEWESLPGCMGYVLGAPVRWLRDEERFRVWELHCGPVHRVYAEFTQAYEATAREAQRAMEWHGGAILLLTLLVLGLERRAMQRGGRA